MSEDITVNDSEEVMRNPKVKSTIADVLERKIRESIAKPKIKAGWEKVAKGEKCLYPNCEQKSVTAAFHGWPLCKTHFGLTQWIAYVVYEKVDNEDDPDNVASRVKELELSQRIFKK